MTCRVSNMRPQLSGKYLAYRRAMNTIHCCQLSMCKFSSVIFSADFNHSFVCEFVRWGFFSFKANTSSLISHLFHIVPLSSKPQMIGITAVTCGNTRVQHRLAGWNIFSVVGNPSNNVRIKVKLFSEYFNRDSTITPRTQPSLPKPTFRFRRFINFRPKPFLEFRREYLRKKFWGYRLAIHNSCFNWLLCHAFGCWFSARAFLF